MDQAQPKMVASGTAFVVARQQDSSALGRAYCNSDILLAALRSNMNNISWLLPMACRVLGLVRLESSSMAEALLSVIVCKLGLFIKAQGWPDSPVIKLSNAERAVEPCALLHPCLPSYC